MTINIKENLPLYIGLAIPVLMILFVAGAIYLPGLFVQPQYSFLYAVGSYSTYLEQVGDVFTEHRYSVEGSKLTENTRILTDDRRYYRGSQPPRFYIYDVKSDQNREVNFADAQLLSLDAEKKSPDGYEVTYGSREDGVFPFFFYSSRDYDKRFLKGNNVSHEIRVKTGSESYGRSFNFIGWVLD